MSEWTRARSVSFHRVRRIFILVFYKKKTGKKNETNDYWMRDLLSTDVIMSSHAWKLSTLSEWTAKWNTIRAGLQLTPHSIPMAFWRHFLLSHFLVSQRIGFFVLIFLRLALIDATSFGLLLLHGQNERPIRRQFYPKIKIKRKWSTSNKMRMLWKRA